VPTHEIKLQEIDLKSNLSYEEHPIDILDFSERKIINKTIKIVKVQWSKCQVEKVTWELEDEVRRK
jgi:hypothetical protein